MGTYSPNTMVAGVPLEKELLIKGLGRITKSAAGSQLVYTELTLEEQEIGSIELLSKYPHLHHVQLARNRITDLKPLGSLPNLLTLDLTGNSLTDALDFSTSDNLQRAYLGSNQIRELSSLPQHRHIATLVLSDNKISSLAALSGLKQLRYLDASSNQLTSLAGMCGQPIQELHLSHNRISELSGIETLQELQVVTLNHNKLQTLSPLENNLALYAVEANNNCLDLNPVVKALQGLPSLRHLSLTANPLCTGLLLSNQNKGLIAMPDMRRATYPDSVLYQLLRLETLDGAAVRPTDKVRAANMAGAETDAHLCCYEKYFPPDQELPIQDRELVLARLMRPMPYKSGRLVFPDPWIHRQLERCLEGKYMGVCVEGGFMPSDELGASELPIEETFTMGLEGSEPCHMVMIVGCHDSCNAALQTLKTQVVVQQQESREWRVRRLIRSLDKDNSGSIDKKELDFVDRNGRFFDTLDADKDGTVTGDELVAYFNAMAERRGTQAVDAFVAWMEESFANHNEIDLDPQPPVRVFLESSCSQLIATTEGSLTPGEAGATYQVVARAVLDGAAMEAAGEKFFCWMFGSRPFRLGGIDATPIEGMVANLSNKLIPEEVSITDLEIEEEIDEDEGKPDKTKLVGNFGDQEMNESTGGIDERQLVVTMEGKIHLAFETHSQEQPAAGKPLWLHGDWTLEMEGIRAIFRDDANEDAVLEVTFEFKDGEHRVSSLEATDAAVDMVNYVGKQYCNGKKFQAKNCMVMPIYNPEKSPTYK